MDGPISQGTGKEKELVLKFSADMHDKPNYHLFLLKTEEDHLEIQLATSTETEDTVTLDVKEIFNISADVMFNFCLDIADALIKYEKKYGNKKGWPHLEDAPDVPNDDCPE